MASRLYRGCTTNLTATILKELRCLEVDKPRENTCLAAVERSRTPVYSLTPTPSSLREGQSVTIRVDTSDDFNDTLYWTISGPGITNEDFLSPPSPVSNGGAVSLDNQTGEIELTTAINND